MSRRAWLYDSLHTPAQILRPFWRLGLDGAVHTIPLTGPLIVACNHASFIDPLLLGLPFPRKIHFLITDDWYYRSKAWETFFAWFATEPVRGGKPRETIHAVCRLLEQGKVAGIFPEGRISHDGTMQRFRPGLARIAALSGAPVLPVAIHGSFRSLPRTRLVPFPTRVRIRVARPVYFAGKIKDGVPDRDSRESFKKLVFDTIQAMLDQ